MNARILNIRERQMLSDSAQQAFLALYADPSTNLFALEQALASVLSGLETFGRPGDHVSSEDLVETYSRIHLMTLGTMESPYDYLPRRGREELMN